MESKAESSFCDNFDLSKLTEQLVYFVNLMHQLLQKEKLMLEVCEVRQRDWSFRLRLGNNIKRCYHRTVKSQKYKWLPVVFKIKDLYRKQITEPKSLQLPQCFVQQTFSNLFPVLLLNFEDDREQFIILRFNCSAL